jgi:hypothetical protein
LNGFVRFRGDVCACLGNHTMFHKQVYNAQMQGRTGIDDARLSDQDGHGKRIARRYRLFALFAGNPLFLQPIFERE